MTRILVILTGGTIGSKVKSGIIDVNSASAYEIISLYFQNHPIDVEFEVIQPLIILSENTTPKEWTVLCQSISAIDYRSLDGIIITHGSDTLSYTSALIGLLYHHLPIPVVLIAANYAPADPRSNGLANFRSAVCLIKEGSVNGVFTIFQNNSGIDEVFLSTRITEADNYQDQFSSYGDVSFGQIVGDKLMITDDPINPSPEEIHSGKSVVLSDAVDLKNNVLLIKPYPGLDYRYFDLSCKPKAILHCLYHSATACTKGYNYSLLKFIKRCKDEGIDFYVSSFKSKDAAMYATSKEILDSGAIPLINISVEAAYAKLMLLYNQDKLSAAEFMNSNVYFESLPEKGCHG